MNTYNPNDRLYLVDIKQEGETLPQDQVRVLFSDAKGNLTTAVIEKSVLDTARDAVVKLGSEGKGGAAVSIETSPGLSATFGVEITEQEAAALNPILQASLETHSVPSDLIPFIESIINRGTAKRKDLEPIYNLSVGDIDLTLNTTNMLVFGLQEMAVKSDGEMNLVCMDCYLNIRFVIVPKRAWKKVDEQSGKLCNQLNMGTTLAIEGISSRNPFLLPAFFDSDMITTSQKMERAISQFLEIPSFLADDARKLLSSTWYIKNRDQVNVGVELCRIGKKLNHAEMFTRDHSGNKLEIFHTCIAGEKPQAYSFGQMTKLKLKGLKFW